MKRNKNTSSLVFFIFVIVAAFTMFAIISVEARKHHNYKKNKHNYNKHQKDKSHGNGNHNAPTPAPAPAPAPGSLPHYGSYPTQSTIFDILSFGAKGDGVSDDSQALVDAWKAACKVPRATIKIPAEIKFLIKPITLQGPCMPHLVLQIDGTVLAPPEVSSWPKSNLFQWFNFKWVHDFTIQGPGTVNGQGSDWWTPSNIYFIQKKSKHVPYMKPTALRFYASYNVTVRDIEIINSPQCHLKFDNSKGIKVNNITISSPENSPNTDGIHLQNTQDVEIQHSNIATGDDCISIQTGCSNIHVHHINCGPGHGISVGGLGKDKSVACVKYDQIIGSYTVQPIHLACSDKVPCLDVDLIDIQLKPSLGQRSSQQALCWNSYGKSQAPLVPSSIDYCLRRDIGGSVKRTARSHEHVC
ncbi:hypothetical protein JCGZ_17785 [Jatropha curcas]|uniref:Polygalacturonase n=1 Tax=Jatropha curcas TaxID=180498 RepID=A0A067JRV1_JATCU|nr:hypothetical protein JCGZ_17785 [Jatropha curcas]